MVASCECDVVFDVVASSILLLSVGLQEAAASE